jgi:hypothetical protein
MLPDRDKASGEYAKAMPSPLVPWLRRSRQPVPRAVLSQASENRLKNKRRENMPSALDFSGFAKNLVVVGLQFCCSGATVLL